MNRTRRQRVRRNRAAWTLAAAAGLCLAADRAQAVQLNLMHFSDGESSLLTRSVTSPSPFNYSGVATFATLIDQRRNVSNGDFDLLVTAGDNFLAGPQFEASRKLPAGSMFYDAKALQAFGVDVGGIGNHEFDFGPQTLANFIDPGSTGTGFIPFVSSNLVIPNASPLKPLIKPSTIVTKTVNGTDEKVGVVGVTTPLLKSISSPGEIGTIGDTVGNPGFNDLVATVQGQVDSLIAQGVDKIVLVSHLQSISEERTLAGRLQGVDVIVAAGSDTRLANADDPVLPLSGETRVPSYPLIYDSADGLQKSDLASVNGDPILIVSTDGEYKYLGNLVVDFDASGKISAIAEPQSGPKRNTDLDGLTPRSDLVTEVQNPVAAFVQDLKQTPVGTTEVPLDSIRTNVRAKSTLMGSLIADALRDAAQDGALAVGLDPDDILVAVQNGGGIRNDRRFLPGDTISAFDTFDVLPFSNFVTIVQDVTAEELLSIFERSVASQIAPDLGGGGQFLQVSGLEIVYDVTKPAHAINASGQVTFLGQRIQSIFLDPDHDRVGYYLYDLEQGGFVVDPDAALFDLATINFTALGGDNFAAFAGMDESRRITLPISYQQALEAYIREDLGGDITAAEIAAGQGIRVRDVTAPVSDPKAIPEPATASLSMLGLGLLTLAGFRRRR